MRTAVIDQPTELRHTVFNVGTGRGQEHAVNSQSAFALMAQYGYVQPLAARTLCGQVSLLSVDGIGRPVTYHAEANQTPAGSPLRCDQCAWHVACLTGWHAVSRELECLRPRGGELAALRRVLEHPAVAYDTAYAIARLADEGHGNRRLFDSKTAESLAFISAHRPRVLQDPACAAGACGHDRSLALIPDESDQYCTEPPRIACGTCTFKPGLDYTADPSRRSHLVEAPCAPLAQMAAAVCEGSLR